MRKMNMQRTDIPESRKADHGKLPISLIPYEYTELVAKVLAFGATKYDPNNWRTSGLDWTRVLDAALRHLGQFEKGEDLDLESSLPHLAHAACCIMFLTYYQIHNLGKDTRWKRPSK
jgi:hypothetical protein